MELTVTRFASDTESTVSLIRLDGRFECFGLEDEHRKAKVPGETRIPAGTYKVGVRTVGGFHGRYSAKFPALHQGMLHILDVPNFEYVLIHIGNDDGDTAGCLLVGVGCVGQQGAMYISNSTGAYKALYPKVIDAAKRNDLTITFIDD